MPLRVTVGNDETAPGRHRPMAPVVRKLAREFGMQVEAPPRQRIQRRARAPVAGEETAGLAGGGIRDLVALDDDDLDAAAGEEIGGAGADHAAAADHNAHGISAGSSGNDQPSDWFAADKPAHAARRSRTAGVPCKQALEPALPPLRIFLGDDVAEQADASVTDVKAVGTGDQPGDAT